MELGQTLQWRGRTVAWDTVGSGPPVVMCHGTPWSSALWAPFARALAAEFCVYLWDMPGYGQSSMRPEDDVNLGVQGELLADLLTTWGLESPHVVAHDYGGAVSLRALLLHDARYASLCLVDVVALSPWGSDFFRLVGRNVDAFAALPPAIHKGAVEVYVSGASHRGLSADQLAALTAPWVTEQGQAAFYRQIAQADQRFTDEVQDRYAELALPLHIIWGAEDGWVPVERAHQLQRMIPQSTLEVLDGAGHLVHYDAPVALAVALHRWLSTVTQSPSASERRL